MPCDRPSGQLRWLTVWDDSTGKPIFGRWKPRFPLAGAPPVSETEPAGISPHPETGEVGT